MTKTIASRKQDQPPAAVAIAWRAQQRLHRTHRRLNERNKRPGVRTIAVARELAGFCWAIKMVD